MNTIAPRNGKKTISNKLKSKTTKSNPEINDIATSANQEEIAGSKEINQISNTDQIKIQTDIRETVHELPQEEIEGIQRVVKEAEEKAKNQTKLNEIEKELEAMTDLFEKTSKNLNRFAIIADKLLENLPEEEIKLFMQTDDAEFYRTIIKNSNKTT
jgi:gas vesicle protein